MNYTSLDKIKNAIHFLHRSDGSLSHKVLRSGFWVGISTLLLAILGFGKNIILARLLTPEIFGLMGICLMVMRGIELFTETGFGAALIHWQGSIEEAKETVFSILVLRGFVLALVLFSISPIISSYYERTELQFLIQALALVLIIQGFNNINKIAREKELDYRKLSYLHLAGSIINFVVVVVLAYFMRSVWALILGLIIASLTGVVLSYLIIPGRLNFGLDKKIAKRLFSYGKYITGLTIVLFIASEIDNAVIGKVFGMEMLGYYVVAFFIANLPATHISKVVSRILFPAYSKIQDDIPALEEASLRILQLIATVTIPASLGIAILAPEIIFLVYGDKWLPAVVPLRILCLFGGIRSIVAIFGYLYNAIGKPNISFYLGFFKFIMIALLIYPFAITYGIAGIAWSVTIPIFLELLASLFFLKRLINVKYFDIYKIVSLILIKSSIMCMLLYLVKYYCSVDTVVSLGSLILSAVILYSTLNFSYAKQLMNQFRN